MASARGPLFGNGRRRVAVAFGAGVGPLSGPAATVTPSSAGGGIGTTSAAEVGGMEVGLRFPAIGREPGVSSSAAEVGASVIVLVQATARSAPNQRRATVIDPPYRPCIARFHRKPQHFARGSVKSDECNHPAKRYRAGLSGRWRFLPLSRAAGGFDPV